MDEEKPSGILALKVVAMPADTNPAGDVFGGWLISQLDIAGGIVCRKVAKGRITTVAMDSIRFFEPVLVGDTLCCYVDVVKIGNTSMEVKISAFVNREFETIKRIRMTVGNFTYVKIDEKGQPVPIENPTLRLIS